MPTLTCLETVQSTYTAQTSHYAQIMLFAPSRHQKRLQIFAVSFGFNFNAVLASRVRRIVSIVPWTPYVHSMLIVSFVVSSRCTRFQEFVNFTIVMLSAKTIQCVRSAPTWPFVLHFSVLAAFGSVHPLFFAFHEVHVIQLFHAFSADCVILPSPSFPRVTKIVQFLFLGTKAWLKRFVVNFNAMS